MKLARITILLSSLGLITPIGYGETLKEGEKGYVYSPVGKRDPFKPLTKAFGREVATASSNPLEQFGIEQLQLRAILRGGGKAQAMFEDPEGVTHILHEGDVIGREKGTVSKILSTEVIVTERTFDYLGRESLYEKVVSLPQK